MRQRWWWNTSLQNQTFTFQFPTSFGLSMYHFSVHPWWNKSTSHNLINEDSHFSHQNFDSSTFLLHHVLPLNVQQRDYSLSTFDPHSNAFNTPSKSHRQWIIICLLSGLVHFDIVNMRVLHSIPTVLRFSWGIFTQNENPKYDLHNHISRKESTFRSRRQVDWIKGSSWNEMGQIDNLSCTSFPELQWQFVFSNAQLESSKYTNC